MACQASDGRREPDPGGNMAQVIAIIRPFRARAVLEAIAPLGVAAGMVREVMGFGRQKGRLHTYLGSEYDTSFLPKIELTLFVEAEQVAAVVRAIVREARTGRMGDGKILIQSCRDALEPGLGMSIESEGAASVQ